MLQTSKTPKTATERNDRPAAPFPLFLPYPWVKPRLFLADKGYDGDAVREELLIPWYSSGYPAESEPQKPALSLDHLWLCNGKRFTD